MQNIGGDKLRGHVDTMVLSVLEKGDAHGLAIIKRIEESGSGVLHMKEGSLYPALYRLEKAGLVSAKWDEQTKGRRGPRRKIYKLTRKGRNQLARGREQWQQFVSVVGAIVGG
jgi:transcriptional regulator